MKGRVRRQKSWTGYLLEDLASRWSLGSLVRLANPACPGVLEFLELPLFHWDLELLWDPARPCFLPSEGRKQRQPSVLICWSQALKAHDAATGAGSGDGQKTTHPILIWKEGRWGANGTNSGFTPWANLLFSFYPVSLSKETHGVYQAANRNTQNYFTMKQYMKLTSPFCPGGPKGP